MTCTSDSSMISFHPFLTILVSKQKKNYTFCGFKTIKNCQYSGLQTIKNKNCFRMTRRPGVFSFLQNDTSTYAKACHVRPTRPTCPTRPTKTLSTETANSSPQRGRQKRFRRSGRFFATKAICLRITRRHEDSKARSVFFPAKKTNGFAR